MKRSEKREHLIDVAASLFNRLGYHAAGIDLVIAEAGIAKTTLYRHFKSKEDLIVAVLKRVDTQFRDKMRTTVEASGKPKGENLLATFEFLEAWFKEKNFHGCPFISAAGEFGDQPSMVFQEAAMHKRLIIAYFEELARADGLRDPQRLAEEINLLHEGATAVAHITGDPAAAAKAKAVAERLIRQARSK
ncbi:MAG: TetR/AcrR family transcriptional regulator [Proteobacteria bacterium]|nr:TetR/AcrR family transcriptional regulator [Pseudomonadota bacterium]